ncbi:hypothetical protein ABMA27_001325 [Loxostege sticticalis]|uniref:FLYWCH-type domain-containing protein n=1 Tax=Loxostege sticticalis TaxID=481309 RepID=A0ABR3HY20_LOXSC
MIPTKKGNHLLMINGFTYRKDNKTQSNYYCSKLQSGCRARVKLTPDGEVKEIQGHHIHEPPTYVKTSTGVYIKQPFRPQVYDDTNHQRELFANDERFHVLQRQQELELLLFKESVERMQGSGEVGSAGGSDRGAYQSYT